MGLACCRVKLSVQVVKLVFPAEVSLEDYIYPSSRNSIQGGVCVCVCVSLCLCLCMWIYVCLCMWVFFFFFLRCSSSWPQTHSSPPPQSSNQSWHLSTLSFPLQFYPGMLLNEAEPGSHPAQLCLPAPWVCSRASNSSASKSTCNSMTPWTVVSQSCSSILQHVFQFEFIWCLYLPRAAVLFSCIWPDCTDCLLPLTLTSPTFFPCAGTGTQSFECAKCRPYLSSRWCLNDQVFSL